MAELDYNYTVEPIDPSPGGDSVIEAVLLNNEQRILEILQYLNEHKARTESHGVGQIVGTTESQTLTNKSLSDPVVTYAGEPAQNAPVTRNWVENNGQLYVNQADTARQLAEAAQAAAATAQSGSEAARDASVSARQLAEAARDIAISARDSATTEINSAAAAARSSLISTKSDAVDEINAASASATSAITGNKNTAISDINTTSESARNTMLSTKNEVITDVDNAVNSAYTDVQNKKLTAISDINGTKDVAVKAVNDQWTNGVEAVRNTGQAELDKLTALVPAVFDQNSFFNSMVASLLSGQTAGQAGAVELVALADLTISARVIRDFMGVTNVRLQAAGTFPFDELGLGYISSIDPSVRVVLFGNSGRAYVGHHIAWAATEGTAYMDFSPKFGDFRFDFTEGKTYPCAVFQESADKQVGTVNVVELFSGGREQVTDEEQDVASSLSENDSGRSVTGDTIAMVPDPAEEDLYETLEWAMYLQSFDSHDATSFKLGIEVPADSPYGITSLSIKQSGAATNCLQAPWISGLAPGESMVAEITPPTGYDEFLSTGFWLIAHCESGDVGNKVRVTSIKQTRRKVNPSLDDLYSMFGASFPEMAPDPDFAAESLAGWYVDDSVNPTLRLEDSVFKITGMGDSVYFQGALGILPEGFSVDKSYYVEVVVDALSSGTITVNSKLDTDLEISAPGRYTALVRTDDPPESLAVRLAFRNVNAGEVVEVSRFSVKEFAAPGALNTGYWNGKTLQSQLLGEAEYNEGTGILTLILSDIPTSFRSVKVLNAAREWVEWTRFTDSWGDSIWSYSSSNVKMFFDLASSYASHGFQSVEDMRNRSAVRPDYQAKPRRFRTINNPENVQIIGDHAYIYNGNYNSEGRQLVQELIGAVPAGAAQLGKWTPITSELKFTDSRKVWELSYDPVVPRDATANPAVAMVFGQYVEGGTYRIVVWFKELVYDPDTGSYGDDGIFYIVDGRVCVLDQNGNYVLAGCMGYDTGIAVPA